MIHGQLTILRAIEREDLDALWRWSNDPAVMYFWTEPYKVMSRAELDARFALMAGEVKRLFSVLEPALKLSKADA